MYNIAVASSVAFIPSSEAQCSRSHLLLSDVPLIWSPNYSSVRITFFNLVLGNVSRETRRGGRRSPDLSCVLRKRDLIKGKRKESSQVELKVER
jgi:hypothetical protein